MIYSNEDGKEQPAQSSRLRARRCDLAQLRSVV